MTTSQPRSVRTPACGVAGFAALLMLTACNTPPGVNPWQDDSLPPATWNTPSFEGIRAADKEPVIRHREIAVTHVDHQPAVPHYPVGWEDPFESNGDGDGRYAWTWLDYVGMPYGLGRFIVNTIGFPVTVVLLPPGTSMVSDGVIAEGQEFDSIKGKSPDPVGERADFGSPGSQTPPFEIVESDRAQ